MSDLIDRAEAISRAVELRMYGKPVKMVAVSELERLPKHGETTLPEQADSDGLGVKTGETCADVISRQAAIEKFEPWLKVDGYSEGELNMLKAVLYELRFLPSAQAEERTNKHTETLPCDLQPTCNQLATDTISRQAAIDLWEQYHPCIATKACEYDTMLRQLPSAQPSGKDPIEREAVVEILHDAMQGCSESEENLIGEIVCKVDLLPSAQPEIIRCRECKHSEHWYRDKARCFLWHEEGIDVFEDGYCSYAERRTDG